MLKTLQANLYRAIPISKAMQVTILNADEDNLQLAADLESNRNDKGTAFGGSINTLATMAGWLWVDLALKARHIEADIVIQRANIVYSKPIGSCFIAECQAVSQIALDKFITTLTRRKKARLNLSVNILAANQLSAQFTGYYVATR